MNALPRGPWLISPQGLELLKRQEQSLKERQGLAAPVAKEDAYGNLIEEDDSDDYDGRPWDVPGIDRQGSTAIINLNGPLYCHGTYIFDLMCWAFGGYCYEWLHKALAWAADCPKVNHIVLSIDSPGGYCSGISDAADRIKLIDKTVKPVTAHVGGCAASAAYWLAAACGEIVLAKASLAGCIGVVLEVFDDDEALAKEGIKRHQFVSSQTPRKRPDPAKPDGKQQFQDEVDGLAQVFIESIADYRGVSTIKINEDFGQGALLVANEAIKVGMADSIGSLNEVILRGAPVRYRGPSRYVSGVASSAFVASIGDPLKARF